MGHVFPGPWLWKLILFRTRSRRRFVNTLGEAGMDSITWTLGFCAIQVLVRTLLCGMFLLLCQITTLLILAVFVVTHLYYHDLIFAFTLEFKQMVLVMRSCFLCPMNTTSSWLTQERGLSRSHLAVHKCRGLLKFCVLEDNWFTWHFRSVYCASRSQTQRNYGMSKTWCLPSAITSQLGEVMSSSLITCP